MNQNIKREISLVKPTVHDFDLFCQRAKVAFDNGCLTNNGPFLQQFELGVKKYLDVPTAAVSNGTIGLIMALKAKGLKGKAIVPSFTYCATVHAVVWAGLEPIFVDIDPETFTLDPVKVREAITPDTSVILGVHVFGNPCAIDELAAIATEHNLILMFDSAHAFGATYCGKQIGGFGAAEVFSTHATKTFMSAEGGLVTTHDLALLDYIRRVRAFGIENVVDTSLIGTNAKLSELHAIVGLDSLSYFPANLEKRKALVRTYKEKLSGIKGLRFQKIQEKAESSYFFFSIVIDSEQFGMNRDELAKVLAEAGVQTRKYFYLPVHQHAAYKQFMVGSYNKNNLSQTEYVAEHILCLPTHVGLTFDDINYITSVIAKAHESRVSIKVFVGNNGQSTERGNGFLLGNKLANGVIKRVLVTGGAGYVGCVLVQKLLNKGYQVRVLDKLIFGKDSLQKMGDNPHLDLCVGAVEDKYTVAKCLECVDAIIHLSGLSNDPSCEINPELTRKENVDATKVLLALAKEKGVRRFVYASSCSVYGFTEKNVVVTEGSSLNPLTAYAKSKVDCEELILPYASDNFGVVCLRKATIYGPSSRMRFDLVINTMTGMAMSEKKITINGGEQWRPFLHVEDAADAYIFMLEAPLEKVNGQIFNVGSNEQNLRIVDLAQAVSRLVPEAKVEKSDSSDTRSYHVSFDKINKLGWRATKTIDEGIVGVQKMFVDGRVKDFRDLNYFNIKRLITYLNI